MKISLESITDAVQQVRTRTSHRQLQKDTRKQLVISLKLGHQIDYQLKVNAPQRGNTQGIYKQFYTHIITRQHIEM
jgi:short subunit dehydrogenase-like uncharacterized protein